MTSPVLPVQSPIRRTLFQYKPRRLEVVVAGSAGVVEAGTRVLVLVLARVALAPVQAAADRSKESKHGFLYTSGSAHG